MQKKLLTTTLLSISLLSLNLSAGTGTDKSSSCAGGFCMAKLPPIVEKETKSSSPKIVMVDNIENILLPLIVKEEKNSSFPKVIMVDNIETIILPPSAYISSEDEIAEYEFEEMQKNLLIPSLNSEDMPISDYFCEDDLKPVLIAGVENTYECTKS